MKSFERDSKKKKIVVVICKGCGKEFVPEYGNKKRTFCSDTCGARYGRREQRKRLGGNEHRHRARRFGVSDEPVNVLRVFARDGWVCQICGRKATANYLYSKITPFRLCVVLCGQLP